MNCGHVIIVLARIEQQIVRFRRRSLSSFLSFEWDATMLEILLANVSWNQGLLSLLGWRPSLVGWRPSLVCWRPWLLGWRPSLVTRLEAIATRVEAIASRWEALQTGSLGTKVTKV